MDDVNNIPDHGQPREEENQISEDGIDEFFSEDDAEEPLDESETDEDADEGTGDGNIGRSRNDVFEK